MRYDLIHIDKFIRIINPIADLHGSYRNGGVIFRLEIIMSKDPAVLFYTSDFLSGTQFFTDEQCGQYIRLLCQQHQLGHIPEQHMLNICKTHDSPVMSKFVKDPEGLWYNERMELEKEKRANYCNSRKINRLSNNNKKHMSNHMLSHMDNENENENDNNNDNKIKKETKHIYGEYKHVLLTDEQYEKLKVEFPNDYGERIKLLDEGIEMKGYKYKNHYLTIKKWAAKDKPSSVIGSPEWMRAKGHNHPDVVMWKTKNGIKAF